MQILHDCNKHVGECWLLGRKSWWVKRGLWTTPRTNNSGLDIRQVQGLLAAVPGRKLAWTIFFWTGRDPTLSSGDVEDLAGVAAVTVTVTDGF